MIHVIATIELKPGYREDYLKILKENVPKVKAEDGCLAYEPTIDIEFSKSSSCRQTSQSGAWRW